jgi:hypothetical protein
MRKVIVSTYMTLDGRVDEIRDWALPYDDDRAAKYHTDLLMNSDGLLLGRKTHEIFAATWPSRSGELPYIDKLNSMAKYVASTATAYGVLAALASLLQARQMHARGTSCDDSARFFASYADGYAIWLLYGLSGSLEAARLRGAQGDLPELAQAIVELSAAKANPCPAPPDVVLELLEEMW